MNSPRAARGLSCLKWRWRVALLVLHLLPYLTRPGLIGGDEPHYALMAHSIAVDGDLDLRGNYIEVQQGSPAAGARFAGRRLDPHLGSGRAGELFLHPIGLSLALAPGLALQQSLAPGSSPDAWVGWATLVITWLGLLTGWRLLAGWCGDERRATLVTVGFYFSSPLWFYSRTLFTEPWSWPLALFALAAWRRGRLVQGSLWLGALLTLKETTALIALPLLCQALWQHRRTWRRSWPALAGGPVAFGAFFIAKNLVQGEAPFATFQSFQSGSITVGLMGLAFDPIHGLLPFAPLALLAIFGWLRHAGRPWPSAWSAFALYFVVSAAWIDWRGGSCYGPRLLVPVLPALAVPLLVYAPRATSGAAKLTFALFLVGFTVQGCAALDPFFAFWGRSVSALLLEDLLRTSCVAALGVFLAWGLTRSSAYCPPLA